MPAVRLFFGADFILSKNTDIYFEVKAVLCLDFYAFGDVFRRNGIVPQIALSTTVLSLRELFRRIKTPSTSLHLGKAEISPRQATGADERTRLARRSAKHEDGEWKTAAA